MKANELRIGNLIENYKSVVVTIQGINYYSEDDLYLISADKHHLYDVKDIKPIKLTEEWLKKCGAIVCYEKPVRLINNQKIPDCIKEVHELQNWYYWHFNKTELIIN